MKQDFINKHFFELFIFTYIFGLLLYGTIGYDGIDEICAFILFVFLGYTIYKSENWGINKYFLITIFIFLFYLGYSFIIHSNVYPGIIKDFIIQFKPYLAFFAVYQLAPKLNINQKNILRIITVGVWILLLFLGILNIFSPKIIQKVMFHEAFYAACITAISLIYLYCGDNSTKTKIIFILMLSVGLLSTRSKFYGFYMLAVSSIVFFNYIKEFKFNFKTIFLLSIIIAGIIVVGWEKIDLYFAVSDAEEDVESGLAARMMLYITSVDILKDYFPFGSGFGSFASYSSGVYYSPIYAKYGIDKVWGMTSNDYSFIADTYYPCLAQFGVAGILLYIIFLLFIVRKSYVLYQKSKEDKYLIIPMLIIGYLLIESIADATFTGHRGFFIMMFLGLVLSEQKQELNNTMIDK